ncbi:MAG: metallophosphatase family protein, partial [Actinomycetota bacterium]|nr:metallophosphatase family protein [Actinomycetota bacterium]
ADIHGNVQALDAVLADPRCAAAERIVVLGDVIAGTFPAETFDRLVALGDRVRILRGNADRLVLEGDIEESRWVRDRLGPDRISSVAVWPTSFAIDVEHLGAVRCCHATPRDDEEILTRIMPEADLAAALEGTNEPVVIGGHTHVQFDRRAGRRRFVNVGSVGRPWEGSPGAYWALLGPDVELLRTEYDVQAAAEAALASGQPSAERVAEVLLRPPTAEETTAEFEALRRA